MKHNLSGFYVKDLYAQKSRTGSTEEIRFPLYVYKNSGNVTESIDVLPRNELVEIDLIAFEVLRAKINSLKSNIFTTREFKNSSHQQGRVERKDEILRAHDPRKYVTREGRQIEVFCAGVERLVTVTENDDGRLYYNCSLDFSTRRNGGQEVGLSFMHRTPFSGGSKDGISKPDRQSIIRSKYAMMAIWLGLEYGQL